MAPWILKIWQYSVPLWRRRIVGKQYIKTTAYAVGELDTVSCQQYSRDRRFNMDHGYCPICQGPGKLDTAGGYRCTWNDDHGPFTFAAISCSIDDPEAFQLEEVVGDPEWACGVPAPNMSKLAQELCLFRRVKLISKTEHRTAYALEHGRYVTIGAVGTIYEVNANDPTVVLVDFSTPRGLTSRFWIAKADLVPATELDHALPVTDAEIAYTFPIGSSVQYLCGSVGLVVDYDFSSSNFPVKVKFTAPERTISIAPWALRCVEYVDVKAC